MKGKIYALFSISLIITIWFGMQNIIYCQEEQVTKETSVQDLSEMDLNALLNLEVTTASKKAEKTSEAPGVITTITAEEIQNFGGNNLMDILQRATSIQPLSVSVFPQNIVSIRGDLRSNQDNHVLLLINGRPVREGTNGGTDEAFFAGFPIGMISKIEIIRGPGSVLYGTNAFAGVINIITQNDDKSSVRVSTGTGSFGSVAGEITSSIVVEDFNAKIGAKIDNATGWDFNAMTKMPGKPDQQVNFDLGQRNLGLSTDINYKGFRLLGFYSNINHSMLGIVPYSSFVGKNKFSKLFLNLGYVYNFNEKWDVALNATHNSNILYIDEDASVSPDRHRSMDYLGEVTVNGNLAENVNVVVGGVFESRNKNTAEEFSVIAPYHQKNLSAYFQADYKPVKVLKLIAGGQFNKPDGSKWDFVPRAGVIYNITEQFGAKALYGQAFRSPYPLEQFIQNPVLVGNPNLTPEKIGTFDAQLFYSNKAAEVYLSYFNSHYTNSISRIPTANPAVSTFTNQGELTVSGLELEGKTSLSSKFFLTGSATYQKNKEDILVTPHFMAKIGLLYNTDFGIKVGLFNSYFGAPRNNGASKVNPEATAVSLASANIIYKLPVSLPIELGLYIQNIFNAGYYFTEFNRNWINTFPLSSGRAVYAKVSLSL